MIEDLIIKQTKKDFYQIYIKDNDTSFDVSEGMQELQPLAEAGRACRAGKADRNNHLDTPLSLADALLKPTPSPTKPFRTIPPPTHLSGQRAKAPHSV